MLLIVGSIVIQALLIVHCIKTGRNTIWIWVIALLSYAGIVAYVAVELLPELFRSRTAQRTVRGVKKALDPEKDLRHYESQAKLTGNVASRLAARSRARRTPRRRRMGGADIEDPLCPGAQCTPGRKSSGQPEGEPAGGGGEPGAGRRHQPGSQRRADITMFGISNDVRIFATYKIRTR